MHSGPAPQQEAPYPAQEMATGDLAVRVFATWAIFPFLHSLVGKRDSTDKEVFTWIGQRKAEQRSPLLLWAIVWAKGFILVLVWANLSLGP